MNFSDSLENIVETIKKNIAIHESELCKLKTED